MSTEIQQIKNDVSSPNKGTDKSLMVKIEKFNRSLNREPKLEEVKINKHAGNSAYLPISFIEMTLDEMFFGQWDVVDFKYQVIANEIVGSVVLVVENPITGREIRRTGAASVMIQMTRGSSVLDVGSKIKNTLVKDFPHLKSSCISNAAKSLGKLFGRDLNRSLNDEYQPIVLPHHEKLIKSISEQISSAESVGDLSDIYTENMQDILSDPKLVKEYKLAQKQLSL